jgi:hypothetical protein
MVMQSDDKHAVWKQKLLEMEHVQDHLGTGLDEKIMETVAVLQLLGLHTRQSCEGHIDHGIAAPWVAIESRDPKLEVLRGFYSKLSKKADELEDLEDTDIKAEVVYDGMHKINKHIDRIEALEYQKLIPYLEEFYQGRTVSWEQRLILDSHGTLICQGAILQPAETQEMQTLRLQAYQEETFAFTQFLKRKFFA